MVPDPPYTLPLRIKRVSDKGLSIIDVEGRNLAYVHHSTSTYGLAGGPAPLDEEGAVKIARAIAQALS